MLIMKIRQTLICAIVALSFSFSAFAQQSHQGNFFIQTAFGVVPTYFLDGAKTVVPPLNVSVNYRFSPVISAGAFSGFSSSKIVRSFKDGSLHQWANDSWVFGVQFAAHSTNFKKVDVYGGGGLAYSQPGISHTVLIPGEDQVMVPKIQQGFVYGGFLGISMGIANNIGAYAELGYGISLFDLGLNVKL